MIVDLVMSLLDSLGTGTRLVLFLPLLLLGLLLFGFLLGFGLFFLHRGRRLRLVLFLLGREEPG
jgi:hypothetical protein